jgi:hypothetical protein
VDNCTILISFKYLQIEIMGVQSKAFSKSKLEGFYRTIECTFSGSASKLEASA